MNYNKNNLDKTLMDLHDMLKVVNTILYKTHSSNSTALILVISHGSTKRKKVSHPNGKGKNKVGQYKKFLIESSILIWPLPPILMRPFVFTTNRRGFGNIAAQNTSRI